MVLTEYQTDSLRELINIGCAQAAEALSQLAGYRIALEVAEVAIHRVDEIPQILKGVMSSEVACVSQIFSGAISGNALLLLGEDAAILLHRLLTDRPSVSRSLDADGREVITEVGNIILNACLGVFGRLLKVHVSFSAPRLNVESVEGVMNSITVANQDLHYGLVIQTRFRVRDSNVRPYLAIIPGVTSLDRLLAELKRWEEREIEA